MRVLTPQATLALEQRPFISMGHLQESLLEHHVNKILEQNLLFHARVLRTNKSQIGSHDETTHSFVLNYLQHPSSIYFRGSSVLINVPDLAVLEDLMHK